LAPTDSATNEDAGDKDTIQGIVTVCHRFNHPTNNKNDTMVLTKTKVIDCRDHLLGRLASIVSKELLAGQKVVLVRCDEMVISGSCECTQQSWGEWNAIDRRL